MDIIDFLIAEHGVLKDRLLEIGKETSPPRRKKKMEELFERFRVHEAVEARLLEALANHPTAAIMSELAEDFHRLHNALWILLDLTLAAFDAGDPQAVERAFANLDSVARAHMAAEDEILFPKIRSEFSRQELEKMGKYAHDQVQKGRLAASARQ